MSAAPSPPDPAPSPRDDRLFTPAFRRLMLVHLTFGLCLSTFLILPKHFAADLGATPLAIGLVMSLHGLANVLLVRPLRGLLQRWTHRRVLAMGTLLMAAGGSVFVWVAEAGVLAAFARFVQGAGWACVFTSGSAMAANLAPPGRMAQAIGFFAAALLGTNAIGPAFAEFMLPRVGPTGVWLIGAGCGLVAFAVALRLPRDGDANADAGAPEAGPGPERAADARRPTPSQDRLPRVGSIIPLPFLGLWLISGLVSGTMFTFHQPLALERGFDRVAGLLVAFTIAALFVRVVSGRLLDRLGHRRVAVACMSGHGVAMVAMNWLGPTSLAPPSLGLFPLGFALGLTHGAFYPAMMAMCMSRVEPRWRALAIARINTANQLGALGVLLLGFVAEAAGYAAVFVGTGLLAIGAAQGLLGRRRAEPRPRAS